MANILLTSLTSDVPSAVTATRGRRKPLRTPLPSRVNCISAGGGGGMGSFRVGCFITEEDQAFNDTNELAQASFRL